MKMRTVFLMMAMLCSWTVSRSNNDDIDPKILRKKLTLAINSGHTTDSLYTVLNLQHNKTPLTTAYLAALDALKAKHAWNPYNKIKYLNTSQALMQQALDKDPHNIEILFMRFSIQHNVPAFLGYGKNLVADREEMIRQIGRKNYGSADRELTISIIRFLLGSKRCTLPEDEKLHQYLAALL